MTSAGEVAGYVDFDILQMGDPPIQVEQQGFGEAYLVSEDFGSTTCDGLFVSTVLLVGNSAYASVV